MPTFELRYIPGTPLGIKFPLWRFAERRTQEAAEATRMQCANRDQIEVTETA